MFSLLGVFDSKPDHPMFDARQAKKMLGNLPQNDAFQALSDVTAWLISVKDTAGFRPEIRAEIIMLLDEIGLPFYEELLLLYIGKPHVHSFKGKQLWQGIHDFKRMVADAYSVCIEEYQLVEKPAASFKQNIPTLCARLMRALSEQVQLNLMRYLEPDQLIWVHLCNCYTFVITHQLGDTTLDVYPKPGNKATPHQEFVRTLMLYIASPATLAPDQIAACYHVTGLLEATFDCKTIADAECTHWIDLASPAAPKRVSNRTQSTQTTRFLGASRAVSKVESVLKFQEQAISHKEQRGKNEFTPDGKLTLLKHLQLYWGKRQPGRSQDRQDTVSTIEVVHGLYAICDRVTGIEQESLVNLPTAKAAKEVSHIKLSSNEVTAAPEVWIVFNASENGVGGVIPKATGAWVKVGDLCAVKLEDSQIWWVGMVRRLKTGKEGDTQVGIEILAKKPLAVWLRIPDRNTGKGFEWEVGVETSVRKSKPAILLPDANNSYANATVLMESGSFAANEVYELKMGKRSLVTLTGLLEEGSDYERLSFALSAP